MTSPSPLPSIRCVSNPPSPSARTLHSQPSSPPTYAHEPAVFHATELRSVCPKFIFSPACVNEKSSAAYLRIIPSSPTNRAVPPPGCQSASLIVWLSLAASNTSESGFFDEIILAYPPSPKINILFPSGFSAIPFIDKSLSLR